MTLLFFLPLILLGIIMIHKIESRSVSEYTICYDKYITIKIKNGEMKKLIAFFAGVVSLLSVCSCSDELGTEDPIASDEIELVRKSDFRIYSGGNIFMNSGITRAGGTEEPDMPTGVKDLTELPVKDSRVIMSDNQVYTLLSGTFNLGWDVSSATTKVTVHVADGATLIVPGTHNGNTNAVVYVHKGGKLYWGWNEYSVSDGKLLSVGNGGAATINCWGTVGTYKNGETNEGSFSSVEIKANSHLNIYEGDMKYLNIENGLFFEKGDDVAHIYSEVPVETGSVLAHSGNAVFSDDFVCNGDFVAEAGTTVIFKKCAYIKGTADLHGGTTAFHIYEYLNTGDLKFDSNRMYLYNAMLESKSIEIYAKDNDALIHCASGTSVIETGCLKFNSFVTADPRITTLTAANGRKLIVNCSDFQMLDGTPVVNAVYQTGVLINPDESEYWLPATECRPARGTDPNPTPEPPAVDPEGEVEINLSVNDEKKTDDYIWSKLSVHIRCATDVEIFIPVEAEYYCKADDFYIVQKHWVEDAYVYTDKTETVSMEIAGKTVTVSVIHEQSGLKITTDGICKDVLDECKRLYNDGLTVEVWNYYNDKMETRAILKSKLDESTVKFIDEEPAYYINAFAKVRYYTGAIYDKYDEDTKTWTLYTDEKLTEELSDEYWKRTADGYEIFGYKNPYDCVVTPTGTESYKTYTVGEYNVTYKR